MVKETNYNSDFWKTRSKKYNNLEWVNDRLYLKEFLEAGQFDRRDVVLEVGIGTGIIAQAIAPLVKEVIGVDTSKDMLEHSNWRGNISFIRQDICCPVFAEGVFDKITARHVFHHILRDTQKAMDECYRILKPGGKMILSEGVPPTERVKKDYIEIFKFKEKRLTFMPEDLETLMKNSGFRNIKNKIFWLKKMSVRNWLMNSGLPLVTQNKIFILHKNAGDYFKKAYNIIEKNDDCLIDMKMVILTGEK